MTGITNGKCRSDESAGPCSPAIVSLESVPFNADLRLSPQMATMLINWNGQTEDFKNGDWQLPLGSVMNGPLPSRFGVQILRFAADSYALNIVWDRTALAWNCLTRSEIQGSSLPRLLEALGSDIDYMLDQPVVDDEYFAASEYGTNYDSMPT